MSYVLLSEEPQKYNPLLIKMNHWNIDRYRQAFLHSALFFVYQTGIFHKKLENIFTKKFYTQNVQNFWHTKWCILIEKRCLPYGGFWIFAQYFACTFVLLLYSLCTSFYVLQFMKVYDNTFGSYIVAPHLLYKIYSDIHKCDQILLYMPTNENVFILFYIFLFIPSLIQ